MMMMMNVYYDASETYKLLFIHALQHLHFSREDGYGV
jgi:hypothetical protein